MGSVIPAYAVGLSIQPSQLTVSAPWGGEGSGELLVSNVTSEPAMYTLAIDHEPAEMLVAPSSFRLDPGATQLVTVSYRPHGWPQWSSRINVVARPLGSGGLPLGSGVRYRIELVPQLPWSEIFSRGGLLGVVLVVAGWAIRRRRVITLGGSVPATASE